jgi:SDR family mycofactocin-dependent oxidoreductase
MGRMDGKVALVTGAARGMGRAHAVRLAEEGADILALDCPPDSGLPYATGSADDLQLTVKEVEALGRRIIAHVGDVREQASLDNLVAEGVNEFGGLDVAVANAGIWTVHPFHDIPESEFTAVLDVNITGVWRTLKAVTPAIKNRGGGSIIVTSSGNGVEGSPHYAHYVASKHGVIGLAKSAALEFASDGIRVNILLPGPTDTPALDWQGGYDLCSGKGPGQGVKEDLEGAKYWAALRDVGLLPPRAMSEAVLWLASDESRWTTGLEMHVDGGHTLLPGLNMAKMAADQPA